MRGNCRTSGTLRKEEGGNVFGLGSRTPIALTLLVKKPSAEQQKAKIYYYEIGSFLTKEQKLAELKRLGSVLNKQLQLSSITPSDDHDWINKKDDLFQTFASIVSLKKYDALSHSFFIVNTRGLETSRDHIVYNSSKLQLVCNVKKMIALYNARRELLFNKCADAQAENYVNDEKSEVVWTRGTKNNLQRNLKYEFSDSDCRVAIYRPYFKQHVYFSKQCNEYTNQWPKLFPNPQSKNLVICVPGVGANKGFSVLITDCIPDVQLLYNGQCFPLYYYEVNQAQAGLYETQKDSENVRHEGISDFALETAQALYGKKISKEDIFYYIYGLLHSPEYRERFKADLTKMLPRVAFVEEAKAFKTIVKIGEKLADLHLNYETVEPYKNVIVTIDQPIYTVEQMRFAKIKDEKGKTVDDKRTIIVNRYIKIEEIPLQAYEYVVNGKSPLEWALERYSYTVDKKSGITNDPNAWGNEHNDPKYILNLLLKLITVSVETVNLVAKLPKLDFIKD